MSAFERLTYRVSQRARVAWYLGHYLAAQRAHPKEPRRVIHTVRPMPGRARIQRAIRELFDEDWRNIEADLYAMPHDLMPAPKRLARTSRHFLWDARHVSARRAENRVRDLEPSSAFPAYFLQNFHFQSGGYLTEESADLYDFQVETLFNGAGDAMRRQALVPLRDLLAGCDQREVSLLDVGCGTGRFLTFVLDNYPKLKVTALDLSPAYLGAARRALASWHGTDFVRANAESIPLASGSQDIVTIVYLFHELPPVVRRTVAREVARVLKPGGAVVFVDSLQYGDVPELDSLLEAFPQSFHEPYFLSFVEEDLASLWQEAGLAQTYARAAFLTKVCVFRK